MRELDQTQILYTIETSRMTIDPLHKQKKKNYATNGIKQASVPH